jgi:2',3'-cyclic-nucleotide 2'-phosphodiesterase / 3'-nucleotidase / 5'-nucleotidase
MLDMIPNDSSRLHPVPWLAAAAAMLVLGACAPAAPPAAPAPETEPRVRIVHTNDFHGRLEPQSPGWAGGRSVGGSAVLAAHFDSARARFDGPTLVLSAGDDYQGTAISNMSWGRATVAVMNAKRYDAASLGNHEFDWGQDTLRARLREESFPRMGANVYRSGTREHPEWIRPWTMIERSGVRVGVIGIVTAQTPDVVIADRLAGLAFGPEEEAIDRYAAAARAAGADFVVVTMHEGGECDEPGDAPEEESRGCRGRMIEIAESLNERVDLIVGGHTHLRVMTTVNGIPLMENNPFSVNYTVTDLARRADSTVVLHRAVHTSWADEVDADTAVARVVLAWQDSVRPVAERVLTTFAVPLEWPDSRIGEYPIGNLIADAHRASTGAHVALLNNGAIRRAMPAGPISYGELFELQPFQNEMVTVETTGAVLRAALENAVDAQGRITAHVSGMTVRYDPAAPAGARVIEIRLDDRGTLGDSDPVTVGMTEFLAGGGDRYTMLRGERVSRARMVDLDALVTHLESLPQPVRPPMAGRWVRR